MVGMGVENPDDIQPQPHGFLLTFQHILSSQQVAVVTGSLLTGVCQLQNGFHFPGISI